VALPSTVPSGTAYVRPEIEVAPGSGTTYVDNVQLSFIPLGTTYQYSSDLNSLSSVTDPLGNQTNYTFDSQGDETSVTDPNGNLVNMTYNGDHRLLTQSTPASENNLLVGYAYDVDGNIVGVAETSMDGTSMYATQSSKYDNLDQVTSATDALGNTTGYQYDADGNLIETDLPDGHKVQTTYDNAGNPKTESVDGITASTYSYDANGNMTNAQLVN
jgi:YD repeat-containing protein